MNKVEPRISSIEFEGDCMRSKPLEKTVKPASLTQVGGNHYEKMAIQPMEYSMSNKHDPMQHTINKYVSRFRDKGTPLEDLYKARHTLDMLIDWVKEHEMD